MRYTSVTYRLLIIITTQIFVTQSICQEIDYLDFQVNYNQESFSANLFIHNMGTEPKYMAILDTTLTPIWFVNSGSLGLDFKVNQGNISYFNRLDKSWIVVNEYMHEIDTLECVNGYKADYHDMIILPSGGYILQAYDSIIVDMSYIVSGGNENASVINFIIQEFDVNKNLIFQWNAWEHLDIADYTNLNLTEPIITWTHGNSIEVDDDSNLIISNRRSSEVIKIDRTTGSVIWYLGGPNNQYTFLNDPLGGFSKQHDVRRMNNGNIMMFDNGNEHNPPISRVVEYLVNEIEMTAELVWSFSHPLSFFGLAMGSAQKLPNNNTLINWGTLNNSGAVITEVDYEKNIVLEIEYPPGVKCYKARKYDWNFLTNLIHGDTNVDNHINILDLYNISDFMGLYNSESLSLFYLYRYDLNKDRLLTIDDIDQLVSMIMNQ